MYTIPNASIDTHAHELIDIMNGERANADNPYFLLKSNIKWTQLNYNFDTNTYNVLQKKSASTTPRDPSSDDAEAQNASTTAEDSSLAAVQGQIAPTSGRESSSDAAEAQNASTAAEDPSLAAVQGQIAPPTADREPSSNAAEAQMTPEAAQRIVDAYSCGGLVAPPYIVKIANSLNKTPPKDQDTVFNELLQHDF